MSGCSHVSFLCHSSCLFQSPNVAIFSTLSASWPWGMRRRYGSMDISEEDQLERVDSPPESEGLSMSSSFSSLLTMSSSGEMESFAPILVDRTMSGDVSESAKIKAPGRPEKCVGKNNKGVSWGFTSVIGRRREMEDAVAVFPGFMSGTCDHVGGCTASGSRTSAEISPIHFFGVYDGHGGSEVAKFCAKRMQKVVAEEWEKETATGYEWRRRWEVAFTNGFERTDNEVVTEAGAADMVGTTAVVVVVSGCQIIVSNCGDSRAVLCRQSHTVPLTVDQKPDREDELMRIEELGGKVINWMGARVLGVLAMSRAIGDRHLRPWIIPVPEITFMTRSDEDECVILASDGLWDVMTNEEVGEVARRFLKRRAKSTTIDKMTMAQTVADNLTKIAFGRNSCDNISIVVIDLKSRQARPKNSVLDSH